MNKNVLPIARQGVFVGKHEKIFEENTCNHPWEGVPV